MHLKKGTTKTVLPILMLLGIGITGFLAHAVCAQTILSPAPVMALQEPAHAPDLMMAMNREAAEAAGEQASDEKLFHIPIVLNQSVESQIEYFTTRGRSVFQSWLNRSARYISIMKRIFREHNLPEDLVYVAMIESGFNPHAVSPKNAVGCWQFMKPTAREYGLNADRWVDERRDPIKSTRAAAAHFKDLYNLFGSWALVLASYNAGMGTMQGAVLKAGSADFWELSNTRFIQSETQEYVPRYMAALIIAKNPDAYGFTPPDGRPFEYEEIVVQKSTDLCRIAEYVGRDCKDIKDLNPELLQVRTPRNPYVLRIPAGTSTAYHNRVIEASGKPRRFRAERRQERIGGHLFTRLASAMPGLPERTPPATIVAPYAAHLSMADSIRAEDSGRIYDRSRIFR